MTQKIPNDREERLEFLRNLHRLRNKTSNENVKIKHRNFEKQYLLIKKLQAENEELKQKIAQLSECDINIQVGSSYKIAKMTRESNAAMARFTERMRNETRKYREKSDG